MSETDAPPEARAYTPDLTELWNYLEWMHTEVESLETDPATDEEFTVHYCEECSSDEWPCITLAAIRELRRVFHALATERAGLAAEVERLRESLEPFAAQELPHMHDLPDEHEAWLWLTVGHIRRARQALAALAMGGKG